MTSTTRPPLPLSGLQPEDRVLLISARPQLCEGDCERLETLCRDRPLHWDLIYAAADRHGVAPLVYANVTGCKEVVASIPAEVLQRFRLRFATNLAFKQQLTQSVVRFLEYLASQSMDGLLVKSMALDALVYQARPYTTCRDADLVLRHRREALSPDILSRIGHLAHDRAVEFDFFEHHDLTLNGVLPVDFAMIWRDALRSEFHGQPVHLMCPEDLLIAACVNVCRKRFFHLKALCDTASVCAAYPALDWQRAKQKAIDYGCDRVLYAALRVTQLTVGCEVPEGGLAELGMSHGRAKLIEWLATRLAAVSIAASPAGARLLRREATLTLLLPYAIYRPEQIARKLKFVWHTR